VLAETHSRQTSTVNAQSKTSSDDYEDVEEVDDDQVTRS
jgi:hypothetical protein